MRLLAFAAVAFIVPCVARADESGWQSLFDGQSMSGWKVAEHPEAIRAEDGKIVCDGARAHAYYEGPVGNHDFKNFELELEAMTTPGASSGVYFHTAYQDKGFPGQGYEAQINNTHRTPKRTGSLYGVIDLPETTCKDNEWIKVRVVVKGKTIAIYINGTQTIDYAEPAGYKPPEDRPGRVLGSGTIALQCTDPMSKVYFRNIRIHELP